MGYKCNIVIIIGLLICFVFQWTMCAPTEERKGSGRLTGQNLIDIGIKLDKPLLKLVGATLLHIEHNTNELLLNMTSKSSLQLEEIINEMCRLHPCSDWTKWSKCDENRIGEFGGQNRSRKCGLNTTYCETSSPPTMEFDTRVCEGKCQHDYSLTKHGFCLKVYDSIKERRDDAESVCRSDGGHLVNIDSFEKVPDVNETLLQRSYTGDSLWIDGRRSIQAGPWKYGYQPVDTAFTFWGDNDPDNGANDLCITYYKGSHTGDSWRLFDYDCSDKYEFICQTL